MVAEPAIEQIDDPVAEHVDVIIVGAGLSGIAAGYHLQDKCPTKQYLILEGREAIGGTWDLFRYPGIRSDSDMYTLGYSFKPWTNPKSIADGPDILDYIRETATENNIDQHIRFSHHVVKADWSSETANWLIQVLLKETGEIKHYRCNFLFMCSGYYDYESGFTPDFEGMEKFKGTIIHPQKWPQDVDFTDDKIIVIGSGATAVTLVPQLAKTAAHVTMLQRSPTYVVSRPDVDTFSELARKWLPESTAYWLTRWKNVLLGMFSFNYIRRNPAKAADLIIKGVRAELGEGYDVAKHFTPSYNPWDQRLCLVPNGDLFKSIKDGAVSVVTETIVKFTANGILLKSGEELDADIIVTATGLNMQLLSGIPFTVDGVPVDFSKRVSYKGMMCDSVPNMVQAMGYTNASWTLKCDLTCEYLCRLLNHMDRKGVSICQAVNTDPHLELEPMLNFSSGYVQRMIDKFPKQGAKSPWRLHQNYALDTLALGFGSLEDDAMVYSNPTSSVVAS